MSTIVEAKDNWGAANGKRWEDYDTIVCPDGEIIDMVKLLDDQDRAKAALVHIAPAFGGFVTKLRFVYTFKVKTQATDGFNVFVNPQFTNKMDLTGKCFVMAHEIMHCLLNHLRRTGERDPWLSNLAGDYECNITLCNIEAAGQSRSLFQPKTVQALGGLYNEKYKNWGFEKIYDDVSASDGKGDMSNNAESKDAKGNSNQNAQNQQGGGPGDSQGDDNQGGGGQAQNKPGSAAYNEGWKAAVEIYNKTGKIPTADDLKNILGK